MVPICLDVPLWFISCPGDERSRGRARFSVTQLNQESGELHHWTNTEQRHNFFFSFCPMTRVFIHVRRRSFFPQLPDANPSGLFEMRRTNTCGKHCSEENVASGSLSLESTRSC